jgi:hypothetical protein
MTAAAKRRATGRTAARQGMARVTDHEHQAIAEVLLMAISPAEEHLWKRLCRKYGKRPLFGPGFALATEESGVIVRAVWPRNPLDLILSLKGFILGGILLSIAVAIATGLKTGRPEYVPMLGALGVICIGLNLRAAPVQRARITGRTIELTIGRFPFHRSASLANDGGYGVGVKDKRMPTANDRNRHGPALCLTRADKDGAVILVAAQDPAGLRPLEDSLHQALRKTSH